MLRLAARDPGRDLGSPQHAEPGKDVLDVCRDSLCGNPSSLAISRLVMPCAMRRATSSSRGTRRLAFLAFHEAEPRWLTPTLIIGTHPQLRPLPGTAAREP